jgi:hypothetical protein
MEEPLVDHSTVHVTGNPGKRSSTDQPLTEHDVAERIGKAMLRLTRILQEVSQMSPTMQRDVRHSRYWPTGLDEILMEELQRWHKY